MIIHLLYFTSFYMYSMRSEIRMAPGILEGIEECCEVILFTVDIEVLGKVAKSDEAKGSI